MCATLIGSAVAAPCGVRDVFRRNGSRPKWLFVAVPGGFTRRDHVPLSTSRVPLRCTGTLTKNFTAQNAHIHQTASKPEGEFLSICVQYGCTRVSVKSQSGVRGGTSTPLSAPVAPRRDALGRNAGRRKKH
ncbi:hypothetical protein CERSUDRAFT_115754, partial [Gelatoporia subvermispora B]